MPATRKTVRKVGPVLATALVAGNMIGSGIFLLPASLAALIPGACAGARATVTPVPSSHAGTLLGPAVHCTGIWAVSA